MYGYPTNHGNKYTTIYSGIQCTKLGCRRFGPSMFWFINILVCQIFGRHREITPTAIDFRTTLSCPTAHFLPHTYISIGFGYVRIYRHGENDSCRACLIEQYISIYGNMMKYSHKCTLVSKWHHSQLRLWVRIMLFDVCRPKCQQAHL